MRRRSKMAKIRTDANDSRLYETAKRTTKKRMSQAGAYGRNVDLQLCFKNIMFVPHNKYRVN